MKNKEKYAKEIAEQTIQGHHFAFDKQSKRVVACSYIRCDDCLFHGVSSCAQKILEWGNTECEESKRFTEREKAFITLFPEIKYIARDKWGKLFAYKDKPEKYEDREEWFNCDDPDSFYEIHFWGLEFNSIKWEDEEPTSREEILGK